MKLKFFTLMGLAAMLFAAGCQKQIETPVEDLGGELQTVTFTATMDNSTVTKAAVDGDGAAANVNRCIMEIYYGDALFTRMYSIVSDKKASFTTQIVANRTYTVAFWADHVESTSALETDLYYATTSLKTISLNGDYAGNIDARDAFFHSGEYTIAQAGSAFTATLYRPFAQVNVITTDWDKVSSIASLKPDKVDVTIQNPLTKFNAVTGEASADASVTSLDYKADLYTAPAPVEPVSTTEKTLSMDYLFAATDKAVIDIAWKAQKTDNTDVSHSFTNIPYQRNFRTNIKGNLLTTQGQWTVTVDPVWEGEYDQIVEVKDIKSANAAIQANASSSRIDVKFSAEPNDSGVPTGTESSTARAILTTPVAEGATLSIEVASETNALYIGDYEHDYDVTTMATSTTPQSATVNINVPSTGSIGTLVINAPSKTVYINGKKVTSVGTITNLDAITSYNTLVIEANQTVTNLIVRQGALEIHGSVNAATVTVTEGKHVYVRDCEGLIKSVYDVLKPYIDVDNGYAGEQEEGKETYRVYQKAESEKVAKIGDVKYYTLTAAFAAVQDGQTIELLKSCSASSTITVDKSVTLNLGTYTLTNACSGYSFDLNTAAEGKTFKITGTDANNCGHIVSNGTEGHSGVACINSSSSAVTFEMDYVKVHGDTEADAYVGTANSNSESLIKDCTTASDIVNLTDCTIKTTSVILGGTQDHSAAATLNITGGSYTGAKGFRYAGTEKSVIDGATITVDQGIALYPYSDTDLKNSFIYDNATGNLSHDAISVGGKGSDLNITNTTVQTVSKTAVAAENLGKATITSGTFKSTCTSNNGAVLRVNNTGGQIDVNGGTFDGSECVYAVYTNTKAKSEPDDPAGIYIYGGTFTGGSSGMASVSSDHATVEIGGGTFVTAVQLYVNGSQWVKIMNDCTAEFHGKVTSSTTVTIPAGTFKKAIAENDLASGSTITGGTFYEAAPYSAYIKSGYEAQAQGTDPETWKIVELPSVAVIGTTKYQTLAAAFSAVKANETIKLTDNTTITSGITVSKTCTLDLNGFVISDNTSKLFTTSGSITFTITDNSANHDGKITTTDSTPSSCEFVHMEFSSPKLVINNGVFEMYASSGIMFRCQGTGAMCDINGGHFISGGTQTIVVEYYQNTSYNNQITGGTFEAISVNGSQAELIDMGGASGSKYITVTISGGTFSESGTQTKIFNGFKMSKVIIKKVEGRDEPEFSCTNTIFQGVFTLDISAGKFTGSGSFFKSSSGTNTAHSVISGGTFHYTNSNKWTSSGIFDLNCTEQYFDITGGTFTSDVIYKIFYLHSPSYKKVITVTGGTFTENPAEAYRNYYNSQTGPFNLVPDGYTSTETSSGSGIWTVTAE